MDIATLRAVQVELESAVTGKRLGRLFPLSRFETVADMHLADGRWLFISIEPANPRIYLIRRRLREIEKQSISLLPFHQLLKKRLSEATVERIEQIENERVLLLSFNALSELGEREKYVLAVQLTGRSSNLFLIDDENKILATARESHGDGQKISETYSPPQRNADAHVRISEPGAIVTGFLNNEAISDQLDRQYLEKQSEKHFQQLAQNARTRITSEVKRKEKLQKNLQNDLANHGDADKWKRFGDILLANTATAKKKDGAFTATDYFDDDLKQIEIPFENDESLPETAEKYFRRYTKARNAADEIARRLLETENELKNLRERLVETEEHIADRNIDALEGVGSPHVSKGNSQKKGTSGSTNDRGKNNPRKHTNDERSGYRTFISSDGMEILVGKKAKDNDQLTLRVAKSLDTWMHAADYPGSHVVIRDSGKREVPNQTLLEAAELAAFYSQGRKQVKAAVHYTQKKFVNKPKGSAPGLVSLASFKTLLVEPKIPSGVSSS